MNDDLISREDLRKAFHERIHYFNKSSWDEANAIIDSVPTVELLMARMADGVIILIHNGKVVQVVQDNLQEWRPDHD